MELKPVKVTVVGDDGVGKTSAILSYVVQVFPTTYLPKVYDPYCAKIVVKDKAISSQLWDSLGTAEGARLRPLGYPDTKLFILMYSCTNRASFDNVTSIWAPELNAHQPGAPVILAASKTDLRPVEPHLDFVTTEEGQHCATAIGAIGFIEFSAKVEQENYNLFHRAFWLGSLDESERARVLAKEHKKSSRSDICTIM